MSFETVIGLEIHVELKTLTKIFCSCSTEFGAPPNSNTCPICLGMPGVLPSLNQQAVRLALRAGRALNCKINTVSRFDRKNYFYPDLPKGYQITQFDLPLCEKGYLVIETQHSDSEDTLQKGTGNIFVEKPRKRIEIDRIHLEEDAGKLIHPESKSVSLVDYNRAGIPLIEIVTRPAAISPETAVSFLKQLKSIMEYTEVSDCRMEQGSLRCDVNVSVRKIGEKLGTKVEIKNLNSFKEIQKALEYEQVRQQKLIQSGRADEIISETRRWDNVKAITVPMRIKGGSQHYYISPEPDLPPLDLSDKELITFMDEALPELPMEKRNRFISQYELSRYEADILTESRHLADYFEEVISHGIQSKEASNWILTELLRLWKHSTQSAPPIDSRRLAELIKMVEQGIISRNIGKDILWELTSTNKTPQALVEEKGLTQVSDRAEIQSLVQNVLNQHQHAVQDYKNGSTKSVGYLMGQIMKANRGKVNPKIAREILENELNKN